MKESYVDTAFMTYADKIPSKRIPTFREALQDADDGCYHMLVAARTYNVTVTVLLSIFLGTLGIDRFYLGDKGRGVGKLLLTLLATGLMIGSGISVVMTAINHPNAEVIDGFMASGTLMVFGILAFVAVGIWAFIDIFVCIARAKEKTFQNLMRAL